MIARRRLHPCVAALAAALLAGCVNLQPPHRRPDAPVAEQFPLVPAGERGTPAAQLPWQRFFAADPALAGLIDRALANNRDLRVAVLNIEAARAQLGVREADRYPSVGLSASAARQPSVVNGRMTTTITTGFALSAWELDFFGRVRSLADAAAAQLAASEQARQAAQISLVASVANGYFALAGDEQLLALTRETLANRQSVLQLQQLRFDNGVASELDLRLAQTAVESARATLLAAERQRALDRNALELLVGEPLPAQPTVAAWNPQALSDVPAGLPAEVLLQRPDVRQAEEQLRAAEANIGAARAAFWPRISLTASVGVASNELSTLFSHGTAWTFVPQLLMPLFDAGRNRANLQLSQAQREIAVAQYERAVQAAFRDVADALAGRATLGEQLQSTQRLVEAEAARLRLTDLRMRNGVASSLELLDAQRSLFSAQQQLVQTQLALLQNRITAYRALGGGWESAAR